jgi:hypothetical protein
MRESAKGSLHALRGKFLDRCPSKIHRYIARQISVSVKQKKSACSGGEVGIDASRCLETRGCRFGMVVERCIHWSKSIKKFCKYYEMNIQKYDAESLPRSSRSCSLIWASDIYFLIPRRVASYHCHVSRGRRFDTREHLPTCRRSKALVSSCLHLLISSASFCFLRILWNVDLPALFLLNAATSLNNLTYSYFLDCSMLQRLA